MNKKLTQLTLSPNSNNEQSSKWIRARIWHIVINNYTEEDLTQWNDLLKETEKYVWQFEIGGEKKTPHIQGHIVFKNARSRKAISKKIPRASIEKVRNITASENYCKKLITRNGEVFEKGFNKTKDLKQRLLEIEYKDVTWKPWQKKIIEILEGPINKREIHWFWENTGNVGKSYIAKYVCLRWNVIMASGKTNDIFNQLLEWREINPEILQFPIIIIDNPRSEFNHINYAAIEQLKNGFVYSGKYKGGQVFGLSPHCIVFANTPPNTSEISKDRLKVYHIGNNKPILSFKDDLSDITYDSNAEDFS